MIDIHTHVLPFVDDGASTLEESMRMLEEAVKQGITHLVCTPHYYGRGRFTASWTTVKEYFTLLQGAVMMKKLPVQLFLGNEIYYRESTLSDLEQEKIGTINQSRYVLLEINRELTKYDLEEIIYEFGLKGYIVIFAHIERYDIYNSSTLRSLQHAGALFQVDANTVVAHKSRKGALQLIKDRLIDFISSDMHHDRPSDLLIAYEIIKEKLGQDAADRVTIVNPTQVIHDIEWKTM